MNVTKQFRSGTLDSFTSPIDTQLSTPAAHVQRWIIFAIVIVMACFAVYMFTRLDGPQAIVVATATPAPTPIPVNHCAVLTYEEDYMEWRNSAQIVIYGKMLEERYYQPMWYAIAASPLCDVDLTLLMPDAFYLPEGLTLDMSPPQSRAAFVEWKQTYKGGQ